MPTALRRQIQRSLALQQKVRPAVRTAGNVSTTAFAITLPTTSMVDTVVPTRAGIQMAVLQTCAPTVRIPDCQFESCS